MCGMIRTRVQLVSAVILVSISSFAQTAPKAKSPSGSSVPSTPLQSFSADRMMQNIKTLSSDEFEGRGPGSRGEDRTVDFLTEQFKDIGLEPGNPDGTYIQKVPMVGITPDPNMKLDFGGKVPQPQ